MAIFPLALGQGAEPSGAYGNFLSSITRRSYLMDAVCEIYNQRPLVTALFSNAIPATGGLDNLMANVQYAPGVVPQVTTFTGPFANPQPVPFIQSAAWPYVMIATPIPVYLNEILQQDEQKIQDVVELRMTDAGNATGEYMEGMLATNLSDNTQLQGLGWLIDDGTNNSSFGNILRSSGTWWQSKRYNVAAPITRALFSLYTIGCFKQQGEKPDLAVCGPSTFAQLQQDFLPLERIITTESQTDKYTSSFIAMEIMGVPIYLDPYLAEGAIWLTNTNYFTAQVHERCNWAMIDFQSMVPALQLNYVAVVLLLCQFINTKPRASSVLYGITGTVTL
jgi:hypothetical protein